MSDSTRVLLAAVPVALTVIGGGLAAYLWNVRQKRRELGLSTQHDFFKLYGEFITNWRLWNVLITGAGGPVDSGTESWRLLERAAVAEAGLEAVFIKASTSRTWSIEELAILGSYRQAFQSLRDAMREGTPLPWMHDSAHGYAAFKYLAARTAALLARSEPLKRPSPEVAAENLRAVTSNYWESDHPGDWRQYFKRDRWEDPESLRKVIAKLREPRSGPLDSQRRPWT